MKDIEDLFKQKLQHHPVAPPADTWEKLQASWQQKERKKKGGWLWLAASVALLLMLGGAFYLGYDATNSVEPIAIELPAQWEANDATVPPAPHIANEGQKEVAVIIPEVERAESEKAEPVVQKDVQTPQRNAELEEMLVIEQLAKVEATAPLEVTASEPIIYQLPEEPLIAEVSDILKSPAKPTVTIIYKSGGMVQESVQETEAPEDRKPLEKALAFFTNIKENGVGFSELRSAKSELISKAFSNKREPMSAE